MKYVLDTNVVSALRVRGRNQRVMLRRWLDEHVLPAFTGRVLSFDLQAARILATHRVPEHAPFDALIAAVARQLR